MLDLMTVERLRSPDWIKLCLAGDRALKEAMPPARHKESFHTCSLSTRHSQAEMQTVSERLSEYHIS